MFEYQEEIGQYAQVLQAFIEEHELPLEWFRVPDHVAIKCSDAYHYEHTVEELLPDAAQTSQVELDGRRLAAIKLTSPFSIGELTRVEWVEVMEPRPEKAGKDMVGVEHAEFFYPDFDEISEVLDENGVAYSFQQNPGHAWVNIVLNEQGQELKLNNRLLADVVEEELADGTARLIADIY
jgi:predicted metalloenzyme YecM